MYDGLERFLSDAKQAGYRAIRIVGDMAWCLDKGFDTDELVSLELRFNNFLAWSYPVIALCQYDARRFTATGMLNALRLPRSAAHCSGS